MPTPNTNAQFAWASSRSRLGLVLGPGLLLAAVTTTFLAGRLGLLPAEAIPAASCAMLLLAVIGYCHVLSFVEFVATVRVLRSRPVPLPVWGLAGSWTAVLLGVAYMVFLAP